MTFYLFLKTGIYWATYGFDINDVHLFPGNDEYERFRKVLSRILKGSKVGPELERRGITPDDIGTHSMRKGASTYCSSGSTACPPSVAVHLRAGWSMGGVQDRYLRHDAAGDMFVGRKVSGLPILQPEFAALPPRFSSSDDEVQRAKSICFPGLPHGVEFVAEFALASLIYHVKFLRQSLSDAHPLFQSPLFADAELIARLRSRVRSDSNNDERQPTGVPPHVQILGEHQSVRSELKEAVELRRADMQQLTEAENAMYDRLMSGVTTTMEERAIQTGVPTCDSMAASIMKRLEDEGVLQLIRPHDESTMDGENSLDAATNDGVVEETVADQSPAYAIHNRGGAMHLFPEGVKLPTGTPEQAWMHWCCGNSVKNLPSFRMMLPIDLGSGNLRKRLSDLKFLMSKIERAAKALNIPTTNLSSSEAAVVFQQCTSAVELPAVTEKNRKRRRGQLVWPSAATIRRRRNLDVVTGAV
jgi:hypothetical protein